MVELNLESLDTITDSHKDTFISVRVGENQKLSRLCSSKDYKFQASVVGERKLGRVDVFRRVGSTSISIKNSMESESAQEVSVNVKDGPAMSFRVRLGAKPEALGQRKAAVAKVRATESDSKVQQAKTYLLEHNLEERLSEAMQMVLREKPADPSEFIAAILRKSAGDYKKLDTAGGVTTSLAVPRGDFAKLPSVGGIMRSPRTMAAAGTAPEAAAPQATSFQPTWNQKASVGTWCSPRSAMPFPEGSPSMGAGSVANEGLRIEAKRALLNSAADGSLEKTIRETLGGPPKQQMERLRLEAKDTIMKASMDGVLENTLKEALTLAATANFAGKPSVGTWLMIAPPKEEGTAER